jgi:hypothetical protein
MLIGLFARCQRLPLVWAHSVLSLLAFALQIVAAEKNAALGLLDPIDHKNLMVYQNAGGTLVPVKTAADWQRRRASILAGMQEVMGPLPGSEKQCPLQVEVLEEVDCGKYVRRLITYSPEPRGRIPAYLLIPKEALNGAKRLPAVLCLHPTNDRLGHKVVVGLGGDPGRDYARELAERGYVSIAPAYPKLANYQPDLHALGYQSGTMKAIWDNKRALDLLESLPFVKPGPFAAIGHSLGGHNAIFTAMFDSRISVVVSSCGFDSFADYMNGNIKGWTSERYMPKLLEYTSPPFDFYELIAALAPRACFVNAPFYDTNFKWRSVYQIEKAAARVYRLFRQEEQLRIVYPNSGHEFPDAVRMQAYEFIADKLR